MLRVEGVPVAAGRGPLSFDVPAGRCIGIQGRSPAEISRFLLAAAGLARPVGGRVLIDGRDPSQDPAATRRHVAITRRGSIDARLRLSEYLTTVAGARRATGTIARVPVTALLERLALNGARALSTTEARAEAALGAALLPSVGLVILDEPFANVSADTRARAIEWIRALADEPVAVLIGGLEERDLRTVGHTVFMEPPR